MNILNSWQNLNIYFRTSPLGNINQYEKEEEWRIETKSKNVFVFSTRYYDC